MTYLIPFNQYISSQSFAPFDRSFLEIDPETYKIQDLPEYHRNLVPYSSLETLRFLEENSILLPFKIITRGDGKTTCEECGSVHGGFVNRCAATDLLQWTWHDNYGWSRSAFRRPTGSDVKNLAHDRVKCKSTNLDWSLQAQFEMQVQFFKEIDRLRSLAEPNQKSVAIFNPHGNFLANNVSRDLQNAMRIFELQNTIMLMAEHIEKQDQAIRNIINKINVAGHALSY